MTKNKLRLAIASLSGLMTLAVVGISAGLGSTAYASAGNDYSKNSKEMCMSDNHSYSNNDVRGMMSRDNYRPDFKKGWCGKDYKHSGSDRVSYKKSDSQSWSNNSHNYTTNNKHQDSRQPVKVVVASVTVNVNVCVNSAYTSNASWGGMSPATWMASGHDFDSWWSQMSTSMPQYSSGQWNMKGCQNFSWMPSGTNWQSDWNNWDPGMWQAHGQSYDNWYTQMHSYMMNNCDSWKQSWPKKDDNKSSYGNSDKDRSHVDSSSYNNQSNDGDCDKAKDSGYKKDDSKSYDSDKQSYVSQSSHDEKSYDKSKDDSSSKSSDKDKKDCDKNEKSKAYNVN